MLSVCYHKQVACLVETVRISTQVITKICTRLLFITKLQKRDSISHLHMCPFLFIMSIEQEKSPTLLFSWQSLSCNQQIFLLGTLLNDSLLHMDSIMISDALNRALYYVGDCFKNTLQVFSAHLLFSSLCVQLIFPTI